MEIRNGIGNVYQSSYAGTSHKLFIVSISTGITEVHTVIRPLCDR